MDYIGPPGERTSNLEKPGKATQSHLKALKPKAIPTLFQSHPQARGPSCREQVYARISSKSAGDWRKVGVGKQSTCYSRAIERLDLVATDPRPGVLRTSLLFSAPLHPDLLAGGEDLTQRRRDSQRAAEIFLSLRFSAFLCVSALRLVWLWVRLGRAVSIAQRVRCLPSGNIQLALSASGGWCCSQSG